MNLWTERENALKRVFDDADREARPTRVQRTYRRRPCLHSEPGPELYWDPSGKFVNIGKVATIHKDGAEVLVTDELREQWDQEAGDVLVIRRTIVGTCRSAGCTPAPEPEPVPVRTDSHAEEPPEPTTGAKLTPPLFWVL